ncbi:MAG: hypothetical protein ACRD0O_00575 [Acidimicrobiia bacterium]
MAALSSPAEAEAPVHPVLVTGRILDDTGQPVAGPVEVRAWPTGLPLSVGDAVEPPLVTTGSADGDGEFTLRSASSPELLRLAEVNNGYVNFVMYTPAGGEWHFSRYLGGRPANSPSPYGADGVRWSDRPDVAAEALEVRTPTALTFDSKSARTPLMCGRHYEVVKTERASTKIGEINAEGDTVHNDFVYGEGNTADSDISVAIRGTRGPWQLTGSYHVGNNNVAKVGHEGGALESMWFSSGFDYHLMRDECRREMVTVHQWRGGIENHPHVNQGCTIDPYRTHAERYGPGGKFARSENRAVTWTNSAEIFGASLTSRSGFSKEVHMQLKFGSARVHLVCGDDDVPTHSKRVFSGNSSPI